MDGLISPAPGGRQTRSSERVDEACDQFEAAWRGGLEPRIEDYLAEADETDRPALLGELIALERELRRRRGEQPWAKEYLDRFPEHARMIRAALGGSTDSDRGPAARPLADTGRNLLFGILALQNNFIGRDDLLAAFASWVADKSRPLAQLLVDRGTLDVSRRALLEALVAEHLKQHGGDTEASLAAVSSLGSVRDDLERLGDDDLQASLVAAASRSAGPGGDAEATATYTSSSSSRAGARFRILRFHREGGLGRVYVARDEELGREVALKEIRPDKLAETELRSRFVLEAEINGGLEHPGIVPVYSLGTYDDGRPFYAMRFVEGDSLKEAIEAYHKAHPKPDPNAVEFRKLLGRFIDVCEAIAFAHSKGVLHRDLKPHNVMLGRFGETLLIDWGLAKATGRREPVVPESLGEVTLVPPSGSGHAPTLGVLGSPAFMSPEQAAGEVELLGPATDVYGLGAILFALLTGEPPVEAGTIGEVLDRTRRGTIRSPRALNPNIPKALEAVCMKALAAQPQERYSTALLLAKEVEHWLADESVTAYPESLRSKLARWARRHRPRVQAAMAALVIIAVVSAVAWFLTDRARRGEKSARSEAQANLTKAEVNFRTARRAVEDSFTLVSEETLFDEPGLQLLRRKLLEAALDYHTRFLRERIGDGTLKRELARSQLRLADITETLGRLEEALTLYLVCRPSFEELVRGDPQDIESRKGLARCLIESADIQTNLSKIDDAEESIRAALGLLDPAEDDELKRTLARTLYTQGRLARVRGRINESRRLGERAVTIQERLVAEHPEAARFKADLSFYYLNISRLIIEPSRRPEAVRMCQRACDIEKSCLQDNPDSVLHRYNLGRALYGIGFQHMLAEHWTESVAALHSARAELERVVRQNPTVKQYRTSLAETCSRLGFVQERAGSSPDSVIQSLERAAELLEDLHRNDPKDSVPIRSLCMCADYLGQALARSGRAEKAIDWFRKGVEFTVKLVEKKHNDIFTLSDLAISHANLGRALASTMRHEEAASSFQKAIVVLRSASGGDSSIGHLPDFGNEWLLLLAASLRELNRPAGLEAALSEYRKSSPEARIGLYNLACAQSRRINELRKGQPSLIPDRATECQRCAENAMFWLRQAVQAGWKDAQHTSRDTDLIPLHDRDDFQKFVAELFDRTFPANPFAP
jgi:serine/threonine-protein kinase